MCKTADKEIEMIWSALMDHITSNFLKAVYHNLYLVCLLALCFDLLKWKSIKKNEEVN